MTREEQIFDIASQYAISETDGQNGGNAASKRGLLLSAFRDGAHWADQHPQWIPVEERLPERMNEKSRFSETVLVYNKDGYKDTAYYDFEEKIWRWLPSVTHWMEIVPPRKEEDNE